MLKNLPIKAIAALHRANDISLQISGDDALRSGKFRCSMQTRYNVGDSIATGF
jgi:hypothetical protein